MKRIVGFVAIAIASLALVCQSADARGKRHHSRHSHHVLQAVGLGVGTASTVGYLALNRWNFKWHHRSGGGLGSGGAWAATSIACGAVSPMVATVVLKRPLTMREGHTLISGCFLPIIGPWLVNAAYEAHPEWDR